MPDLLDESGQLPPHATAMRISSELNRRSQQPDRAIPAETVADIEVQRDERRERAIGEIQAAVVSATQRGQCSAAIHAHAVEGRGHVVDVPVFHALRDELEVRGYVAMIEEDMSDDAWKRTPGKHFGSLTLTIDWSGAGPGLGTPEADPIVIPGFDEDAQLQEQQRAIRLMLDHQST